MQGELPLKFILIGILAQERVRVLARNRANMNRWRAANRERARMHVRNSAKRHPETKRRCDLIWYHNNKEFIKASRKRRIEKNPEKAKESRLKSIAKNRVARNERFRARYASDEEFRKSLLARGKQVYLKRRGVVLAKQAERRSKFTREDRDKLNARERERNRIKFSSSPLARALRSIRCRLGTFVKKPYKKSRMIDIIGCTGEQLKAHLEAKFKPGMTWDNYGKFGWHIDHIRPICTFEMGIPEQFSEALNYKNLQPLWWRDNLTKPKQAIEKADSI